MLFSIPYGTGVMNFSLPSEWIVNSTPVEIRSGIKDLSQAVHESIDNPIGTKTLTEMIPPNSSVSIVVNDITRPFLSEDLLPPLLTKLHEAGVNNEDIVIVIATGMHRANSKEEQEKMFGRLPEGLRVINHDAKDQRSLKYLGETKQGTPVIINKDVAESDIKILTGIISPHQQAGFSGGRKSVLPGIASYQTIKAYHSPPFCSTDVMLGKIEGNISHQESMDAARIAKINFILNLVHTRDSGVLKVVAGDLSEAWFEGVNYWKDTMQVKVNEFADISIVSPGGYPRDINLWQSQKAIASAELITQKGGIIILVAQCKEGIGEEHLNWQKLLVESKGPEDAIERFEREGYDDGNAKAFCFARALRDYRLMVVSDCLDDHLMSRMYMEKYNDINEALKIAISDTKRAPKVAVLTDAVEYLPIVEENQSLSQV